MVENSTIDQSDVFQDDFSIGITIANSEYSQTHKKNGVNPKFSNIKESLEDAKNCLLLFDKLGITERYTFIDKQIEEVNQFFIRDLPTILYDRFRLNKRTKVIIYFAGHGKIDNFT